MLAIQTKSFKPVLFAIIVLLIISCTNANQNATEDPKNPQGPESSSGSKDTSLASPADTIADLIGYLEDFSADYLYKLVNPVEKAFPINVPNYMKRGEENGYLRFSSSWAGNPGGGERLESLQAGSIGGLAFLPNGDLQSMTLAWSEVHRHHPRYKPDGTPGGALPIISSEWFILGSSRIASNSTEVISATYIINPNPGGQPGGDPNCFPDKDHAWIGLIRYSATEPLIPKAFKGGKQCGFFPNQSLYVLKEVPFSAGMFDIADEYIGGLALNDSGQLAISYPRDGEVEILNLATMTATRMGIRPAIDTSSYPVEVVEATIEIAPAPISEAIVEAPIRTIPNPGQLAFVRSGKPMPYNLLVISDHSRILRFDMAGQPLPEVSLPGEYPISIASNGYDYAVGTGKNDNRIHFYSNAGGNTEYKGAFGERGGFKAGPLPGIINPQRLSAVTSIAMTRTAFAASLGGTGGSLLYYYRRDSVSPARLINVWESNNESGLASGTIFGTGCDRLSTYSTTYSYVPTATQSGHDWKVVGLTTDFDKYPEDYRKYGGNPIAQLNLRTNDSKKTNSYMVYQDQAGQVLAFFKMSTGKSLILKPSTFISVGGQPGVFAHATTPVPPECTGYPASEYWWCFQRGFQSRRPDVNGNFSSAAAKNDSPSIGVYSYHPWRVVTLDVSRQNGTLVMPSIGKLTPPNYEAKPYGVVRLIPLKGFDNNDNPIYMYDTARELRFKEVRNIMRAFYDDSKEEIYVLGYITNAEEQARQWGTFGLTIYKYKIENDSDYATLLWRASIPENVQSPFFSIKGFTVSNNLVLAGVMLSSPQNMVFAYSADEGSELGKIGRNDTWNHYFNGEWIDSSAGLTACYRNSDDSHRMVIEGLNGMADVFDLKIE